MIKVGVTGGIGSGKTTFCKKLEELGAFVVYADDLAKQLMVSDEKLINAVKNTFGKEAYKADQSLNRTYLAAEAFEKGRVDELNALVHPILWERIDELMVAKELEGFGTFVKEAAILLNHGRPSNLDYVVLLLADKQKRIYRSVERDRTDPKKIEERMAKQPKFDSKTKDADFIIRNNGSINDLENEAIRVFKLLK